MVSQSTEAFEPAQTSRYSSLPQGDPSQKQYRKDFSVSLPIRNRGTRLPSNRQIQSEEIKGILGGFLGHLRGPHPLQIGNHEKGCQEILGLGYLFLSTVLMWNSGCYSIFGKGDQGRMCGGCFEGFVWRKIRLQPIVKPTL